VNRGEVWWVETPGGRRPHLVLTRQAAIPLFYSVLAIPATRTIRGIPTEVELDEADGMPERCALALDNATLIPKELFARRICALEPGRMTAVCAALKEAVECP